MIVTFIFRAGISDQNNVITKTIDFEDQPDGLHE